MWPPRALVVGTVIVTSACGGDGAASFDAAPVRPDASAADAAGPDAAAADARPAVPDAAGVDAMPIFPDAAPVKVYRVGTHGLPFESFDPTSEYLGLAWGLYGNLLLRTLVGYRHAPGVAGNELVPDLATDVPEASDDGLTYIFFLKDGIKFGPPLNREITSADVLYAMRRLDYGPVGAEYSSYYDGLIVGMTGPQDVFPSGIAGIDTPDDKTIIFHLTQPRGDFPYLMAMPATAPIPEEVAKCSPEVHRYGRYVIASGPYMIAGSDKLDVSNCRDMLPIAGFDPNAGFLHLVRNPSYDPKTDDPAVRKNLIDELDLDTVPDAADLYALIAAGKLEGALDPPTPADVAPYLTPAPSDRLQVNGADGLTYVTMNLTQPPFDDVHVRRAVNFVLDKQAMIAALGGASFGGLATHVVPPDMTGGHPTAAEYDPYASADAAGDLDKAKAEMRLSAYDHDGDGVCDDPVCQHVEHVARSHAPWPDVTAVIESSLAKIGIQLDTMALPTGMAYGLIQDPANGIPISSVAAWSKDFPDPLTFFVLFTASGIPEGVNDSLVGLTPKTATDLGVPGNVMNLPSIDDAFDECELWVGDMRTQCWIDLDKRVTEEIAPIVPWRWQNDVEILGPAVSRYVYDQFSAGPAWSQVDVDPAKQVH
jgi:peptide/nickel transport system substrate-binding protein